MRVITSSGTLATLLLGLTALSTKSASTFALPHPARMPLSLTLVAFTFAAIAALGTNIPLRYQEADVAGLRKVVDTSFDDPELDALRKVANNRLNILASAKKRNALKGWALVTAMAAEAAAVGFLVWAMLEIV